MRGYFFDLDDTLFDRGAAFARWARVRLRADERRLAELIELDARGRGDRTPFADVVGAYTGAPRDRVLERFPHDLATFVEPEPGVTELLASLSQRARVAIVTNGGAAQRTKLQRLGLTDVVRAVFVSSEVGAAKPDRALFTHALRWSELAPSDCMFIGDDPERDLAPAAALGMTTCLRARAGERWPDDLPPPRYIARTVAELREVLA